MKGWITEQNNQTTTYFIKENGKYYSVIYDNEEGVWQCECGNIICKHMELAMKIQKEEDIK